MFAKSATAWVREDKWNRSFNGWHITACSIRTKDLIHLFVRKAHEDDELDEMSEGDIACRSIQVRRHLEPADQRTAHEGLSGFLYPMVGSCTRPIGQDLVISLSSDAFASGSGSSGMEKAASRNGSGITPTRLVNVDGYIYSTGLGRGVYKRSDINIWQAIDRGLPALKTHFRGAWESTEQTISLGFHDLDGPNEQLLYAVGGKGDVWRYDGKRWHQCDFPSNERLRTVTVAPDGMVYITGEGGSLWIGKEDSWRLAAKRSASDFFNDSVWFDGKLWLCSDYQLKVWNGEELVRPEHDGDVIPYTGRMDARDGLLLIAGGSYAHCFDGRQWQCLVAPFS
jgi:hypothetical protein